MTHHRLTDHAQKRMNQRGLRDADLRLLLASATQVSSDSYLLTREDVAREIAERKRDIQRLERMSGYKVVVDGETIITCYRSSARNQQRTMRRHN